MRFLMRIYAPVPHAPQPSRLFLVLRVNLLASGRSARKKGAGESITLCLAVLAVELDITSYVRYCRGCMNPPIHA